MKALDLRGQRFGRLLAVDRVESGGGHARWLCRCDCGASHITTAGNLRSGHAKSCGCLSRAMTVARFRTHGHCSGGNRSPEHRALGAIIQRCTNPSDKGFPYYGEAEGSGFVTGGGMEKTARPDSSAFTTTWGHAQAMAYLSIESRSMTTIVPAIAAGRRHRSNLRTGAIPRCGN
jgi:hypothetical protein